MSKEFIHMRCSGYSQALVVLNLELSQISAKFYQAIGLLPLPINSWYSVSTWDRRKQLL